MLTGYVNTNGDGLNLSIQGMMTQISLINIHTDNISNFGTPGYQRKDPVITSFAEYLGPNAVDKVASTEVGRVRKSGNPLDFALNTTGYFQIISPNGDVELTRDGRFKLDKDGYLRNLENKQVLSASGVPVKLPYVPSDLEKEVKVAPNGDIKLYDLKKGVATDVDRIGVVSDTGTAASDINMSQGFTEDSNVFLQNEFVGIMPLRRQFEANRQLFIIQNDTLSRMIQELGRTQ